MSRSYRHYSGFGHTDSHTKQGKEWKRIHRRITRAKMRDGDESAYEDGKRCHRSNLYDTYDGDMEDLAMSFRTEGYDRKRVWHKHFGK